MCALSIAVFGSGGVGGYFGGRLAEAGEDVRFVARGWHLAAIREHGLRVSSVDGDFRGAPRRPSDDPAVLGPVDVILVGVKAWQVPDAADAMRPRPGERAVCLSRSRTASRHRDSSWPKSARSVCSADSAASLCLLEGPGLRGRGR